MHYRGDILMNTEELCNMILNSTCRDCTVPYEFTPFICPHCFTYDMALIAVDCLYNGLY